MKKRAKSLPQKEKLLEVPTVDIRKKDRKKKAKPEICPDPFPFMIFGSPGRKQDLFSVELKVIAAHWQASEYYWPSKRSKIISEKTFFWEFVASSLNAETVPGLSSGKMWLLFDTIQKMIQ